MTETSASVCLILAKALSSFGNVLFTVFKCNVKLDLVIFHRNDAQTKFSRLQFATSIPHKRKRKSTNFLRQFNFAGGRFCLLCKNKFFRSEKSAFSCGNLFYAIFTGKLCSIRLCISEFMVLFLKEIF